MLLRIGHLIFALSLLSLPTAYADQFKVTRVFDGDTVNAEGQDKGIKVRLLGIDAPEAAKKKRDQGQPFSQQATKHLAGLILNKAMDWGRVLIY